MPNDTDPVSASLPLSLQQRPAARSDRQYFWPSLKKKILGPSIKTPELRESEYAAFFPYLWSEEYSARNGSSAQGPQTRRRRAHLFRHCGIRKELSRHTFRTPTIIDNGDFG
jgi:hypothetical protein